LNNQTIATKIFEFQIGYPIVGLTNNSLGASIQVLADGIDVPCRLLKGRQYTGSDDGALNIVKFKDGRYCRI
jgi:hypothetical protein